MLSQYADLTGWSIAVILVLMLLSGMVEPKRTVDSKLRVKDEQLRDYRIALAKASEEKTILLASNRDMAELLRTTNSAIVSTVEAAVQRNES